MSGTFNSCDHQLQFSQKFKQGQYWWRIQPLAGEQLFALDDSSGFQRTPIGSILASVDAIDIEYDPICQPGGDLSPILAFPKFNLVGKFTIGIQESDHPEITMPPTRFSKISRAEFVLPPAFRCSTDSPCDGPHTPGEPRSFFVTPGRDNITSDFSLPGCSSKPCKASDSDKAQYYTTTMNLHFWDDINEDGTLVFDRNRHCRVDLLVSAGKNFGDQGGQAVITHIYQGGCSEQGDCSENRSPVGMNGIPLDSPELACYLELQGDRKTVNGANFEFCGDQAKNSNLCKAPCENSCCAP